MSKDLHLWGLTHDDRKLFSGLAYDPSKYWLKSHGQVEISSYDYINLHGMVSDLSYLAASGT